MRFSSRTHIYLSDVNLCKIIFTVFRLPIIESRGLKVSVGFLRLTANFFPLRLKKKLRLTFSTTKGKKSDNFYV